MIDKTISHYKILSELGRGGMGVVYKAEDTTLRRTVALKFLVTQGVGEEDRIRFLHEAQAAAALDHPNICTVYEVGESEGQAYISMAYIEGQSLKDRIAAGPVPLTEALDIALQAAKGLRAAHEKGIVHRDIKSANIMLTRDGMAKVMDFGLAKTAGATKVTKTGTTLGTAAYMSPEQVHGRELDQRTDIWSLGVVLYEMLAGRMPFEGEYDPALAYAIVNERQGPLTEVGRGIPLEVERVVDRALEKDPGKRYQSAEELIGDLEGLRESLDLLPRRTQLQVRLIRQRRRIGAGIAAVVVVAAVVAVGIRYFGSQARAIDSIAVLPFESIAQSGEADPLIEGMAMDITSMLSQVSGFKKVISYAIMRPYKGTQESPQDIAKRVKAKALVSARIGLEGGRIRASVEMIEAKSGRLLWGEPMEFERSKLKSMMNDIIRSIADHAGIAITSKEEESIARSRSDNSEAYLVYLRGRALSLSYSEEGMLKGIEMLERAIELDSTIALPYMELSVAYSYYGMMYTSGHDEYPKAKKAAMKAHDLDSNLAEPYVALGNVQSKFEWDWKSAEKSFKHALELDSDNGDAHREYGMFLAFMTRFDEAITEARKAIELDPLNLANQQNLGWMLYNAGRFDESIAQFEKTLTLLKEFPNPDKEKQIRRQLIWNYIRKGMYEKALGDIAAWEEKWGDSSRDGNCDWERAQIYVAMGRKDEVRELVDEILSQETVIPWVAVTLGDKELAFRMLEKLYEERNTFMIFTKMAIELEPLRSDPRYHDLIRKLNFPE